MGRELKRVPLDFNYPIGHKWEGYCPTIETFQRLFGEKYHFLMNYKHCREICDKCEVNAGECSESADYCFWHNDKNKSQWFKEVPEGEGWQLWETTSEGSPISPVFNTLEKLCEYAAENCTAFADNKISKEEWIDLLSGGIVGYKTNGCMFI